MHSPAFRLPGLAALLLTAAVVSGAADLDKPVKPVATSPTVEAIKQRGRLRVGNAFEFRTYNFRNPATGRNEGFLADVSRALARSLLGDAEKIEWVQVARQDAFAALAAGKIDVVIDTIEIGRTGENERFAAFSEEIMRSGPGLLVKRGGKIESVNDADNSMTIGYIRGNEAHLQHLQARAPKAKYMPFDDVPAAFAAMQAGRVTTFTAPLPYLYDLASQYHDYVPAARFTERRYYIISAKGDPAFVNYLNGFIAKLVEGGEHERLYQQWFVPLNGDHLR